MVSEKAIDAVSGVGELSATWTVKLETVAMLAVPEIRPLDAKLIPVGGCPAIRVQVYGVAPPVADSVWE